MDTSKSKKSFGAVLLVFFFLLSLSVFAQSQPKRFSLSLTGSLFTNTSFGKFIPLPNTADVPEITVNLENKGISWGLAAGYTISERIEIQGEFIYGRSEIIDDVGIGLAGIPLGETKVSDVTNRSFSGSILYYFPGKRISPYLAAGLGAVTFDAKEFRSATELLINAGAGLKVALTPSLSVFADFKDHISFIDYIEDFEVLYVAIYTTELEKTQHRFAIRCGLKYHF